MDRIHSFIERVKQANARRGIKRLISEYNNAYKDLLGPKIAYFSVLGIEPTASMEKVKKAYREIVKKYHPDVNKSKNAEEVMKRANEAYSALTKGNAFNKEEAEIKIYNMLVEGYNRLLDEDFKKLKEDLSMPVYEWVYEQEMKEFHDWRKRLKRAYNEKFGRIKKIRNKACSFAGRGAGEEYKKELEEICIEAKLIEEMALNAYKKIYSSLEEKEKESKKRKWF